MIDDLLLARLALDAYSAETHRSGTSSATFGTYGNACIIAFRGTNDLIDALQDAWAWPWRPRQVGATVHRGFWLYTEPLIQDLLDSIERRGLPVYLTGHSLGGAAACIFAALCLQRNKKTDRKIKIARLTTFGAPRPGYGSLADKIADIPGIRYVRDGDQVASLPPSWWAFPYVHDRYHHRLPGSPGWFDHGMRDYLSELQNITGC